MKSNFNIYKISHLDDMNIRFDSYIRKDDIAIFFTPALAAVREDGDWSIGFAWLCFSIQIEF